MNKMIFEKNGVVFRNPLKLGNRIIFNPTIEQLEEAGYTLRPIPHTEPSVKVYKFSKLKIIRALGDGWAAKKAMMEEAGVYDQFSEATYLKSDDPVFRKFLSTLSVDEKKILFRECKY